MKKNKNNPHWFDNFSIIMICFLLLDFVTHIMEVCYKNYCLLFPVMMMIYVLISCREHKKLRIAPKEEDLISQVFEENKEN